MLPCETCAYRRRPTGALMGCMRAWRAGDGALAPPLTPTAESSERPWLGFPFHFDPAEGPDVCAGYATRKDPRRTRPRTLWDDESSMEQLTRAAERGAKKLPCG